MRSLLSRSLTLLTDRIYTLPVLVLFPHSRCNCRCVMCDIWKDNANVRELSVDEIDRRMSEFRRLGVRWVMLTGGEALMHSDLFSLCRLFRKDGIRVTIHSTGLLMGKYADQIVSACSDAIVSLDGSRAVHDRVRDVPRAFDRLVEGVRAVKTRRPEFRVTARCVIQKLNYHDLSGTITAAKDMGLDQVSFLGADISSTAFNRPVPWDEERVRTVALDRTDIVRFKEVLERIIAEHADDFASGFIAESPEKLRRIVAYYAAVLGDEEFPPVSCNAPWVSTVVEADGTVRPCFFHRPLGNIHDAPLETILNSDEAVRFRRKLDVRQDETCHRCVCSLTLRPTTRV
ncbi:MAG: radical SAM protein [Candidatus Latescibacteria bacterium]|nr:radical SAM protein [Candidatus Latescibacterota bacterium]